MKGDKKMKYIVITKSKGKCGCSSTKVREVEANTKKEARAKFSSGFYGTVKAVYTQEQWEAN